MNRKFIIAKMEKIHPRLMRYNKKSKTMGLTRDELQLYIKLVIEYLRFKEELDDSIFNDFILAPLLYGKANKLNIELMKILDWNTELLTKDDQVEEIQRRYNLYMDKIGLKNKLAEFRSILRENLNHYYINSEDKSIFKDISMLLTDDLSDDFKIILEHLDYKFQVLYKFLEIKEEV